VSSTTVVYHPGRDRRHYAEQLKGEAQNFSVDFNYWAVGQDSSLDNAVWTVEEGDASVGADSESTNLSTSLVTTGSEGDSLLKVVGTLADGQIGVQFIKITTPQIEDGSIRY